MEQLENDQGKSPSDIARLASKIWRQNDPADRKGISLRRHGKRRQVQAEVATLVTLAKSFELVHSVVPHPSNRWWRSHRETLVVVQGSAADVVRYLNVADELLYP